MEALKQNKTLLVLLLISVVIAGVYFFVRRSSSAPLGDTAAEGPSFEVTYVVGQGAQEVLAALRMIEGFSLDVSVFSDPLFMSLEDFRVPVAPVTPGRDNPFEPLPGYKED